MEKSTAIPAIITGHPFEPHAAISHHDDPTDSDFESHDGDPVLTPTSSRFPDDVHEANDLPPSYEEVQAQRAAAFPTYNDLEVRRVVVHDRQEDPDSASTVASTVIYTPPPSTHGAPTTGDRTPSASVYNVPIRHGATSGTHDGHPGSLLDRLLTFTHNGPDADARYASHLSRVVAIPPTYETTAGFSQVYSKALHARSVSAGELSAFIEGLNALLANVAGANEAQQALLHVADPVAYGIRPESQLLQQYMQRANEAYFAPRGLKACMRTLPQLLNLLPLSDTRSSHRLMHQIRRTIAKADTSEAASKALDPYVEPLSRNVFSSSSNRNINGLNDLTAMNLEQVSRAPSSAAGPSQQEVGIRQNDQVRSVDSLPSYHTTPAPQAAPGLPHSYSAPGVPSSSTGREAPAVPSMGPIRSPSLLQHAENLGKLAEHLGGQVEKWGNDFGKRTEKWGENFGRQLERRLTGDSSWDRAARAQAGAAYPQGNTPAGGAYSQGHVSAGGYGQSSGVVYPMPTSHGPDYATRGPHSHGPRGIVAQHIAARTGLLGHGGRAARREERRERRQERREDRRDRIEERRADRRDRYEERREERRERLEERHEQIRQAISPKHEHHSSSSESDSSDSDSDSGLSSAEEAETERFDAEAEFVARIASIERKASQDIKSLGEKAKVTDVHKIESKKERDMEKAQSDKARADHKYAARTFKGEMKQAHRAAKREIKHERRDWKRALNSEPDRAKAKHDMKEIRQGFKQRKQVSREMYRDAVRNYKDVVKESRAEARDERLNRGVSRRAGKAARRGGWMVWLLIEDLDTHVSADQIVV